MHTVTQARQQPSETPTSTIQLCFCSEWQMGILYQVYWLSFTTLLGTAREYVGMTKVKSGQTPKAALSERRRWHLSKPVAWLKCAVAASVRLYPIGALCGYEDALGDEALEAAVRIQRNPRRCRGGPWCIPGKRSVLPPEHARQVDDVCGAAGTAAAKAAQRRLLLTLPGRALRCHLEGKSYVETPKRVKRQNSGCQNRVVYESSRRAERRYQRSSKGTASNKRRFKRCIRRKQRRRSAVRSQQRNLAFLA